MSLPPPWLRPWPDVREMYARVRAAQDKLRALAAAWGIKTGAKHDRPNRPR
jgi:hypothetical protein